MYELILVQSQAQPWPSSKLHSLLDVAHICEHEQPPVNWLTSMQKSFLEHQMFPNSRWPPPLPHPCPHSPPPPCWLPRWWWVRNHGRHYCHSGNEFGLTPINAKHHFDIFSSDRYLNLFYLSIFWPTNLVSHRKIPAGLVIFLIKFNFIIDVNRNNFIFIPSLYFLKTFGDLQNSSYIWYTHKYF